MGFATMTNVHFNISENIYCQERSFARASLIPNLDAEVLQDLACYQDFSSDSERARFGSFVEKLIKMHDVPIEQRCLSLVRKVNKNSRPTVGGESNFVRLEPRHKTLISKKLGTSRVDRQNKRPKGSKISLEDGGTGNESPDFVPLYDIFMDPKGKAAEFRKLLHLRL
jgi:hypothetical protein